MPEPVTGAATIGAAGSILGGRSARKGARRAADAQVQAAQLGVDETARQFDVMRDLLNPYVEAGVGALEQQQALLSPEGYQQIAADPITQELIKQQETALLQNQSATGGLRGGNTQAALATLRPQLIQSQLMNKYSMLGGLAGMGQAAAGGLGSAAMQQGQQAANLYQQSGAAQAGAHLAGARAQQGVIGDLTGLGTDLLKLSQLQQGKAYGPGF